MLGPRSLTNCRRMSGCLLLAVVALVDSATAQGTYFEVSYPASQEPGALQLPVAYKLWIPADVARLRGVIVHQHGCGFDANRAGRTSAYDLHWQALAVKWDCALLGPAYMQSATGVEGCRPWCDPRNGSDAAFLRARRLGRAMPARRVALRPLVPLGAFGRGLLGQLDANVASRAHRSRLAAFRHGLPGLDERRNSRPDDFRGRLSHSDDAQSRH